MLTPVVVLANSPLIMVVNAAIPAKNLGELTDWARKNRLIYASGGVGVCIATSGPGATNLVTGIANAMMDSIPMVCITGQVSSHLIGSDGFQEVDFTGVTLPITKHNILVTRTEDIMPALRQAFYIASSGRPGPG